MLPKEKRMTTEEFQKTFRHSQKISIPPFLFIVGKGQKLAGKRAVSVSKKHLKSAVKRNLVRRRLYPQIRDFFSAINAPLICLYNSDALDFGSIDFEKTSAKLVKKIR